MSILGNRVKRTEDPRFITGTATFGDDVNVPGALHVTFVRSYSAHARITGVDTSAVSDIPGALACTAADVDVAPMAPGFPGVDERMTRPVVASDVVRHAGEIVAVVVTEQRLQGPDAAELVQVELEDLPATADPAVALGGEPCSSPTSAPTCARSSRWTARTRTCSTAATSWRRSRRTASGWPPARWSAA